MFFEGDAAALVDSGYVSHAELTVALLERSLARALADPSHRCPLALRPHWRQRRRCRHASTVALPCRRASTATIARMGRNRADADSIAGSRRAARFTHDATYADGDEFSLEELNWRALAVPGHDMDALAL